jgi:serine-type D-Ala-D-Ala carboxypeptidase/endopeptidase (penicillin-binding protein 4)
VKFSFASFVLFGLLCSCISVVAADFGFATFADSLLAESEIAGTSWSVEIVSLTGDSIVYEKDPGRLLTPASLTKLFTSAAALDAMGTDFRFATSVATNGTADESGTLRGDLIILAGGDPTMEVKSVDSLHGPVLRTWTDSLLSLGIRRIHGNIVLRMWPYRLESAPNSWEIGDVNAGFAPPVDGFGFNSNVCHLQVFPASVFGDSARFVLDPPFAPVALKSRVRTVPAASECWLDMQVAPADSTVVIAGDMPLDEDGEFLWLSVQDPACYFGLALKSQLEKRDIAVDGDIIVDRSAPNGTTASRDLFTYSSSPLPAILSLMNKESDNFASEHVLRALGFAVNGVPDRRSGLHAVARFAERCGISKHNLNFEDGCGLSRQNLISAHAIVQLLHALYVSPYRDVYQSTLSVSGKDGTLSYRLSSPALSERVFGKTGTMTQVSNIAGYFYAENGEIYAFAMLCNHFTTSNRPVRAAQDRLLERLAEEYLH